MDLTTLAAVLVPLAVLIYWVIDGAKDVTNQNWNGVITRIVAVGAAWAIVALYAHSSLDFGGATHDAKVMISNWSWADQLLASLVFAASAGTGADVLRTFNHADPNVKPTLLPPPYDAMPTP